MVNYQKPYLQPCLNQGPWFEGQGPSFTDHCSAATDHGPRAGVTEGVSQSDLDLIEGGGRRTQGLASRIDGLLDWLAEGVASFFV